MDTENNEIERKLEAMERIESDCDGLVYYHTGDNVYMIAANSDNWVEILRARE